MSDTQGGYKLDEAQAILSEMKALKEAITSGEKEKKGLIEVWERHLLSLDVQLIRMDYSKLFLKLQMGHPPFLFYFFANKN